MQTNCRKCGGLLSEGQSFCTACGSRRDEAPVTNPAKTCSRCGTELENSLRFCTRCGAPVQTERQHAAQTPQPGSQWSAAPTAPPSSSVYVPPPPVISPGPLQT